ncbi:S-layer homology domain-containing protein, partial [Candidatus Saganbacteria bacterium]|nr:S-layer homology domain-containing protein [Candidatus Saganbacteria bacterium]
YSPGLKTSAAHYGVEFWPTRNLALRMGSDANDLTAGVGIRAAGLEFDYAYHLYAGVAENTTHFFSISYRGDIPKRELKIGIKTHADKTIIYNNRIKVSGEVAVVGGEALGPTPPLTVKIGDVNAAVTPDNHFTAEVSADGPGKKLILVEAENTAGDRTIQKIRLLKLASFPDVPASYWARKAIEDFSTLGLIEGYPDGNFKPEANLTRAELAYLLVRAKKSKNLSAAYGKTFSDVPADFWAASYLEEAERLGVIKGFTVKRKYQVKNGRQVKYETRKERVFRPNERVKMIDAVAILARFDELPIETFINATPYADVPSSHWAARSVVAAKSAGFLSYITGKNLNPNKPISRAEAVEMASKTSVIENLTNDLYDWQKGFRQ